MDNLDKEKCLSDPVIEEVDIKYLYDKGYKIQDKLEDYKSSYRKNKLSYYTSKNIYNFYHKFINKSVNVISYIDDEDEEDSYESEY